MKNIRDLHRSHYVHAAVLPQINRGDRRSIGIHGASMLKCHQAQHHRYNAHISMEQHKQSIQISLPKDDYSHLLCAKLTLEAFTNRERLNLLFFSVRLQLKRVKYESSFNISCKMVIFLKD